jgi:hypothetical protein
MLPLNVGHRTWLYSVATLDFAELTAWLVVCVCVDLVIAKVVIETTSRWRTCREVLMMATHTTTGEFLTPLLLPGFEITGLGILPGDV